MTLTGEKKNGYVFLVVKPERVTWKTQTQAGEYY